MSLQASEMAHYEKGKRIAVTCYQRIAVALLHDSFNPRRSDP